MDFSSSITLTRIGVILALSPYTSYFTFHFCPFYVYEYCSVTCVCACVFVRLFITYNVLTAITIGCRLCLTQRNKQINKQITLASMESDIFFLLLHCPASFIIYESPINVTDFQILKNLLSF